MPVKRKPVLTPTEYHDRVVESLQPCRGVIVRSEPEYGESVPSAFGRWCEGLDWDHSEEGGQPDLF